MLDERQLVMRISARVTVPWKMLAARSDAVALQRPYDRRAEPRHIVRLLRESTVPDDRVLRIREHVEHRRVIEREADGFQLGCEGAREPLCEGNVARPA